MSEIKKMQEKVLAFNKERGWNTNYNAKSMVIDIVIESTELMEIFQWMSDEDANKALKNKDKRAKIEEELGDVIWTTLSFAHLAGIDLKDALDNKIKLTVERYPLGKFEPGQKYTEKPKK